jgi:hypothetical protein
MSYIYVGERYQCLISMSANIINVLFCLKGNCRGPGTAGCRLRSNKSGLDMILPILSKEERSPT